MGAVDQHRHVGLETLDQLGTSLADAGELLDLAIEEDDEETVREAAFEAVERAVRRGPLELVEEIHFASESRFDDFSAFEQRILGATHSEFANEFMRIYMEGVASGTLRPYPPDLAGRFLQELMMSAARASGATPCL